MDFSKKETKTNRSTAVDLSCKHTNVKQMGHFHSGSTARSFAKLADLCNNEEFSNDVGQPVAWTEPVVLMLIDVRRAHFYTAARH